MSEGNQRPDKGRRKSVLQRKVVYQPTPVSRYQDAPDGNVIFRWLTPSPGIASNIIFRIDRIEGLNKDETVKVHIWTHEEGKDTRVSLEIKEGLNTIPQEIDLPKATRISITYDIREELSLSGIWISFMFTPRNA